MHLTRTSYTECEKSVISLTEAVLAFGSLLTAFHRVLCFLLVELMICPVVDTTQAGHAAYVERITGMDLGSYLMA